MSDHYPDSRPDRDDEPTTSLGDDRPSGYGDQYARRGEDGQPDRGDGEHGYGQPSDRGSSSPGDRGDSGYGNSGAGHPAGGSWSPGPESESGSVAVAERSRRRRGGLVSGVAALLAAALVGGVVGGVAGYYAGDQNTTAAVSSNAATAAPAVNSLTGSSAIPAVNGASAATVEAVAKSVAPTVVQITEVNGQSGGTGSGSIISSDGMILTNNHVVAAAANGGKLSVTLNDGTTASATIVGRDEKLDVAVIKAKTNRQLTPIAFGDSSKVDVGQPVVAFGSPLGLSGTVTSGIISALRRPVSSTGEQTQPGVAPPTSTILALQTDAAINPGNSGGPLVNLNGQMIAMDSAIASLGASSGSTQSGSIGLGFALPINTIKPIVDQLQQKQPATHGQLGVLLAPTQGSPLAQAQAPGAKLQSVSSGSPAAAAELKAGDIITKVSGQPIPDAETLVATIRSMRPGEKVDITYQRSGNTKTTQVTLGSDAKAG